MYVCMYVCMHRYIYVTLRNHFPDEMRPEDHLYVCIYVCMYNLHIYKTRTLSVCMCAYFIYPCNVLQPYVIEITCIHIHTHTNTRAHAIQLCAKKSIPEAKPKAATPLLTNTSTNTLYIYTHIYVYMRKKSIPEAKPKAATPYKYMSSPRSTNTSAAQRATKSIPEAKPKAAAPLHTNT
jgi:hypothetical protein